MAYVKFSSNFLRGTTNSLQARAINLKNQSGSGQPPVGAPDPRWGILSGGAIGNQYGQLFGGSMGVLRIMSGTMPTSPEIYNVTPPSGTTTLFQVTSYIYGDDFAPTGNNWYTDPTVISTYFRAVIATGVATWFWLLTPQYDYGTGFGQNPAVVHSIIGDVGTVGSGADMEMFNPSLVAGQFLRVINLNLKMTASLFG